MDAIDDKVLYDVENRRKVIIKPAVVLNSRQKWIFSVFGLIAVAFLVLTLYSLLTAR